MKKAAKAAPQPQTENVVEAKQEGEFKVVFVTEVRPSPDNRKQFSELALTELAASVKAMGVAQPILIRPVTPTAEQPEKYEIVAGERRWRASKLAGLLTIPAMVRVLSDLDAAKIRILENLQRENPHEMEEAEGYEQLMMKHGYTADQLAEEISKSRAYVYSRLKLCALTSLVREQFLLNHISASTALLIARIAVPNLQFQAYKEIVRENTSLGPMSHREAASHIQSRYMLDLTQAPFQMSDAKLLASAGSCAKCPKRSGNQPEVFKDISADVCTDPDCFSEKRGALAARMIVEANKKGIPILEDDEQEEEFLNRGGYSDERDYVGEIGSPYEQKNHYSFVGKVLEQKDLPEVKAYIKQGEKLVPVFATSDLKSALQRVGICRTDAEVEDLAKKSSDKDASSQEVDRQTARAAKEQRAKNVATEEQAYRLALYKKLRAKGANGFTLNSLREITKMVLSQWTLPTAFLNDVYDFDTSSDETIIAHIDQAGLPEVQLLLVDLIVGDTIGVQSWQVDASGQVDDEGGFAPVVEMARYEGIDPFMLRVDLRMATIALGDLDDNELADFIRAHPARIEDLKDYILAERPYCLTLLEAAALVNGLEYWQGKFVRVDEKTAPPDPVTATTDAATATNSHSASEAAIVNVVEPSGEADSDAAQLAEQMVEDVAKPAAKRKSKSKSAPALSPAAAWPWPTKADVTTGAKEDPALASAPA